MNKRERAQVVELLRCAADSSISYQGINGIVLASMDLDSSVNMTRVVGAAYNALVPGQALTYEDYRARLLEAAQRVEDGVWP